MSPLAQDQTQSKLLPKIDRKQSFLDALSPKTARLVARENFLNILPQRVGERFIEVDNDQAGEEEEENMSRKMNSGSNFK